MLPDGRKFVNVTADKTLTAADSGIVQNVIADGKVITLPATVAGLTFIIRNGGVPKVTGLTGSGDNASALVTVRPQAGDQFNGNGFTAADAKDALNTKATAQVGDELQVVGDGGLGYVIQRVKGIWARQA